MNDRELLEMAAKAAGIEVEWREWVTSRIAEFQTIKHTRNSGFWSGGKEWNPLTDDGDALRLAVTLDLLIMPYPIDKAVRVTRMDQSDTIVSWGTPADPNAATRRAIVRAAAEIAKMDGK